MPKVYTFSHNILGISGFLACRKTAVPAAAHQGGNRIDV
jgi:hypothetical protein